MGKGDQKTRRGKLFRGTFGKTRPRKKFNKTVVEAAPVKKRKKKA